MFSDKETSRICLSRRARFLVERVLEKFIHGGRLHLPQAAPGSGLANLDPRGLSLRLTARIEDVARSNAWLSTDEAKVTLTTGWCCERWCSVYLILKSVSPNLQRDYPILEVLPQSEEFAWPDSVPPPDIEGDAVAVQTNNIYPWVLIATVLHEVGHAVNAELKATALEMELACDEFAARYLVGTGDFETRDVRMLGLTLWVCSICSESLGSSFSSSATHPNPVERMHRFLRAFVPADSEFGQTLWLLCAAHVIRLARIHERPNLDAEVLTNSQANLDQLLQELKLCW
jgi:hypothetical protein